MGNTQSSVTSMKRYALILSHDEFDDPKMSNRDGNKKDMENLDKSLKSRGFEVVPCHNFTTKEVNEKIEHLANEGDFSDSSCLVIVVATHGNQGGVLYSKDAHYLTSDVWGPLVGSKNFRDVPKIIVFQACRGNQSEDIVNFGEVKRNHSNSMEETQEQLRYPRLPHDPNFILAFSTVENRTSVRNMSSGTWYLQSLCVQLESLESLEPSDDLLSFFTKVTKYVIDYGTKSSSQTPSVISFLPYEINMNILMNSNAQDLTTDASNGKLQPTHYEWTWPNRGRALIFYTALHKDDAEKLKTSLSSLKYETELMQIKDCDTFKKLDEVAADVRLKDDGSLLVAVLATAENGEHRETNFLIDDVLTDPKVGKTFLVPIKRIWNPFIASKCQYLHDKPKIFFFLDNLNRLDSCSKSRVVYDGPQDSTSLVNEHADFFFLYGYGTDFISSLSDVLEKDGDKLELHKLATRAFKVTRERRVHNKDHVCTRSLVHNLPHFESNLRLMLKFEPIDPKQVPRCTRRTNNPEGNVKSKETALHLFIDNIQTGQLDEVKRFVQDGDIDLNAVDSEGRTPLLTAVDVGNTDIIKILLDNEAKVDGWDNKKRTALIVAIHLGNLDIVRLLLDKGAEVDGWDGEKKTALLTAIDLGNLNMVKLLLEHKANVDASDGIRRTALITSVHLGNLNMVKLLLDNGAKVDGWDGENRSALYEAVDVGRLDVVELLLQKGADINAKDGRGNTALNLATEKCMQDMVKLLMNYKK